MIGRKNLNIKFLITVLVGIFFLLAPPFEGLTVQAWRLFSIFVATIIGIILRPYPVGTVALIGLMVATVTGVLDARTQSFTGFQSSTIWLIGCVFFISRGIIKSRLGERLAYHFIKVFGNHSLGLGYAIALTEFLFALFIPSSTARGGGIILPVVKSMSQILGSDPDDHTEKKIGAYLVQCAFHCNIISSATFLTGMVSNPLCQSLARTQGVYFTWGQWFKVAIFPGIISILVVPLLLYKLCKPQLTTLTEAKALAIQKLKELGPIKPIEKKIIVIFLGMLSLWICGDSVCGLDSTATALIGLVAAIILRVISFDDILSEKSAWQTILWLSILIVMCRHLEVYGFIDFLTHKLLFVVSNLSFMTGFVTIVSSYFFLGYIFAGNAAHASALYVAFLSLLISIQAPPVLSSLILAFMSSLYASFTHYGSSIGVIYFSLQYVDIKQWWIIGLIVGLLNFLIWLGLGSFWWKFLGIV